MLDAYVVFLENIMIILICNGGLNEREKKSF